MLPGPYPLRTRVQHPLRSGPRPRFEALERRHPSHLIKRAADSVEMEHTLVMFRFVSFGTKTGDEFPWEMRTRANALCAASMQQVPEAAKYH